MNRALTIMSSRGEVTIPVWLRRQLKLNPRQPLIASAVDGCVMLRPAQVEWRPRPQPKLPEVEEQAEGEAAE